MQPSPPPSEPTGGQDRSIDQGVKGDAELPQRYRFNRSDISILSAARALLKNLVAAEFLRPAELVSVAKLQHVLARLPCVTPNLDLTISVIGPRRKSDEIETWHYWDVGIEGERLKLASGGHFYQPSTGGDSFTTMIWEAIPGETAVLEDYRESLRMVPDVQSFEEGVASIDFASGSYKIEVVDSDNALLDDYELDADAIE